MTAKIHPHALIDDGASIGDRTRVWAFAHVCGGVKVGEDCNLCDHTFFEKGVLIGNRVTVKCGVYVWEGVEIADDVFIGPCVAFTNDLRPRSRQSPEHFSHTVLETGCSIGANATILPIRIGEWAMIGSGSVVTRDVPAHGLVVGNPGRLSGWVCRCGNKLRFDADGSAKCSCGRKFRQISDTKIAEINR